MIPNSPVEFDIDYPDQQRDRTLTFFRAVMVLPMLVVLAALGGPAMGGTNGGGALFFIGLASGLVVIPPMLTIVLREKFRPLFTDDELRLASDRLRESNYQLTEVEDRREREAWAELARKARSQWAQENPY